jgi:soluble lytic murein transglycosylase-like protein
MAVYTHASAAVNDPGLPYRSTLIREAQAVYGLTAPVPMFAGQIRQESAWRADVTAWDNGRGLAQFMDATATMVSRAYPELGAPDPYDPRWAIRALVRYDGWLYARVKGGSICDRWAAALKSYNAGVGYVQRAQRQSPTPLRWFGATEFINAGQSAKNFEYSRLYPRWILFRHQPLYLDWGERTCGATP